MAELNTAGSLLPRGHLGDAFSENHLTKEKLGDMFLIMPSHTSLGRTKKITRRIDNVLYTTQYAYDGIGRLSTLTYPDSDTVIYRYNTGADVNQRFVFLVIF